MSIVLNVSPELEERLRGEAERRRQSLDEIAVQLLEDGLNAVTPADAKRRAAIALLDEWRQEAANMSEQERETAEADWQRFRTNVNSERVAEGRDPVYR